MTALVAPQLETPPLPDIAQTASGRKWVLKEADYREAAFISQKLSMDPALARILSARGVTAATAADYLDPKLKSALPDPFVMKDMDRAAARIARAVAQAETIGVFGDYDVDGVTATSILHRYFRALGADSLPYLPDRMREGYGPSAEAFQRLQDRGADLIITVDCGAAAHDAIAAAAASGLDIVVLDHHQMTGAPPAGAAAVVNPNRPDCLSGLTNLSAAGVAFMTSVAVNRALREQAFFKAAPEPNLMALLDLTALGLVCDVMEMKGLTRVLVAQGLKVLDQKQNLGLARLGERAGAKGAASAYHLGFLLGPRLNAAGRLDHARAAFELLTTADDDEATTLAERLHLLNAERQAIEKEVQRAALAAIDEMGASDDDVIVVAGQGWHVGVVGIVAGRLKETFDKPVIVIGVGDGIGKGSGRSIAGVDLGGAVSRAARDGLLQSGGGHAMAAGLTVAEDAVPAFREFMNSALGDDVRIARENRRLEIDAVVALSSVTRRFADLIDKAGPYGVGNREPVFAICDIRVSNIREVGDNHLSVLLENRAGERVRAIAFRAGDAPLGAVLRGGGRVHVAGKIKADDWRGGDAAQLQISDAAVV